MKSEKQSAAFFLILFLLVGISIGVAYYRYMVRQDFVYFSTEDQVPNQFNMSSYSQL